MENKKTKLTISGTAKSSIKNIEKVKTQGKNSVVIEKEIEIAKDQLRSEGKPESMLDNIAKGKLKRFFKDS